MIKFFKEEANIEFPADLEGWAEINNFHLA